jgi:hypothetical protein
VEDEDEDGDQGEASDEEEQLGLWRRDLSSPAAHSSD